MSMELNTEWTFLIYTNGNNELEPEIWKSFNEINNVNVFSSTMNVIVQISREEKHIIELLRPLDYIDNNEDEYWCGTRRYKLNNGSSEFLGDLGRINMADPKNVYEFILWGTKNYPAKRYALSLGGHIYELIGILPDYSQEIPYLAGFPELSLAINKACKENNINLDVLILDTCFGNSIETIYEFGCYELNPIKYMITYLGKGPTRGLPYADIINFFNSSGEIETDKLLCDLVDEITSVNKYLNLVVINFKYDLIEKLKITFNNIAYTYLMHKDKLSKPIEPFELLTTYDKNLPWIKYLLFINIAYTDLILCYKSLTSKTPDNIPIYLLNKCIPNLERQKLYYRLSFCKSNYWFNLLSNLNITDTIPFENKPLNLEPIPVSKEILKGFLYTVNYELSDEEIDSMINQLIEKKNWSL